MENLRSEAYTLGALLLEPNSILKVIDNLKTEHFSSDKHKIIYKKIIDLFTDGKKYDYFILIQEFKKDGVLDIVGGPGYIVELSSKLATSDHIIEHSKYIVEAFIQNRLQKYAEKISELNKNNDLDEVLEYASNELTDIDNIIQNSDTYSIEEVLFDAVKENQEDLKKYKTGYLSLDNVLKIKQSQLILIAARPSHGKTSLALNMAYNMSKNHKVGVFSLEMSRQELGFRLVSCAGNIPHDYFDNKLIGKRLESVNNTIKKLSNENFIKINDTAGISISKLRAKVLEMKLKDKIELIIVDYIQLMESKGENQNVKIGNISTGLKRIAKEFNIPVIALSQLSRDIDKRPNKRPKLSDLRDSGSLEQDADTVLFLRNYYKDNEDTKRNRETGEEEKIEKGYCDVYCEKQRGGQVFELPLYFDMRIQKFSDKYYDVSKEFEDVDDYEFRNIPENKDFEEDKDSEDIPF